MKKLCLALYFAAFCALPALSQEVRIHNHAFTAPMEGRGDGLLVGLKELAAQFGYQVTDSNGGYVVTLKGQQQITAEAKHGEAIVNGTSLPTEPFEGGVLINLRDFCRVCGLYYSYSEALNTVDVNLEDASKSKPQGAENVHYVAQGSPGRINYVNKQNPGASVELDELAVAGFYTIVFVYRDGTTASSKMSSEVEKFMKFNDVVVYKVNAGPPDSDLCQRYRFRELPYLRVYAKSGVVLKTLSGTGCEQVIGNPDGYMATVRKNGH